MAQRTRPVLIPALLAAMIFIAGCGSNSKESSPTPVAPTPQNYFAPAIAGTTNGGAPLTVSQTFTIDDTAKAFSQTTYQLQLPQEGSQVINAGLLSVAQRGLRDLATTANYTFTGASPNYVATTYNPPQTGSFALELSGQAGGLVQLLGQPAAPLVAAATCPASSTKQTYQFITIPAPSNIWDPATETAYGSVDISATGGAVTFANVKLHTLPSAGGTGAPAQLPAVPAMGICGPTVYGNITNVPGKPVVTGPNAGDITLQAKVGIGPTGLVVEDNGTGANATLSGTSPPLPYNNVLGAGTGAVGLPAPSSAVSTSTLTGAQYLGFIYATGVYVTGSSIPPAFSSHVASFGFSNVPSSCASVAPATGTLIYGGDFANDNPSASPDGFGNCDFAIDLGAQDAASNGLYTGATVWVGAAYPGNTTGGGYSFPAVAIAGQLGGKNAIFLVGSDATQPWAVYLLQSN